VLMLVFVLELLFFFLTMLADAAWLLSCAPILCRAAAASSSAFRWTRTFSRFTLANVRTT
jgi:hypothetical protein